VWSRGVPEASISSSLATPDVAVLIWSAGNGRNKRRPEASCRSKGEITEGTWYGSLSCAQQSIENLSTSEETCLSFPITVVQGGDIQDVLTVLFHQVSRSQKPMPVDVLEFVPNVCLSAVIHEPRLAL
jgi:hypothetical protein